MNLAAGLALAIVTASGGSGADLLGEPIAENYEKARQSLVKTEEEKRKLLSDLYVVNQQVKKSQFQEERLSAEKQALEAKVRLNARSVANLDVKLVEQKYRLKARLKRIYEFSEQGVLRLIFSSRSAGELDRVTSLLKIVSAKDFSLIQSYRANVSAYKTTKKRLNEDVRRLAILEQRVRQERFALAGIVSEQRRILDLVEGTRVNQLESLKAIRDKSRASGVNVDALFLEKKGELAAPVQGKLAQTFGVLEDPLEKTKLNFKGNFYRTDRGAVTLAVHGGRVIHAGWVNGYGNVAILEHGDHYYSVYGNGSRLLVGEGDRVATGDPISETGAYMPGFGSGLYFEVRHFSDALNPKDWLSSKKSTGR